MIKKISWERYTLNKKDKETDGDKNLYNTAFGVVDLDQSLNPFKEFTFWKMYTNFEISHGIGETIEKTWGIDVFEVVSRYLCIIGIGKMFDTTIVRKNLQDRLGVNNKNNNKLATLPTTELLKKELDEKAKYWTALILPNSVSNYIYDDVITEAILDKLDIYEECQELSDGLILKSKDLNDEINNK